MSNPSTKTPHSPLWRNLVLAGFGLCVVVLVVLGLFVGSAIQTLREAEAERNARRIEHELFSTFADRVDATQLAFLELLIMPSDAARQKLDERLATIRRQSAEIERLLSHHQAVAERAGAMGVLLKAWLGELEKTPKPAADNPSSPPPASDDRARQSYAQLSLEIEKLNEYVLAGERASSTAALDFTRLVRVCAIGFGVTIALMTLLGVQYISDLQARRRQAEADAAAQRLIQQRRDLLVSQSPLGVIVWNPDFTVREWNPAAERIFGYAQSEAIGMHADALVPEAIRPSIRAMWAQLLSATGGTRSRNENVTKQGQRRTIEWYNQSLVDERGQTTGVMSLCQDLTDEVAAQAQLKHAYDRYKRAADGAFDGVWEFDYRTGQLDATGRLYEIYGLEPNAPVPPSYWPEHTHPDDMPAYRRALTEHIEGRTQIIDAEYRIRLPDGRYRWVRSRGRVTKDESGRPVLLSGSTRDIDERMAAERKNKRDADFIRSVLGTTQVGLTVTDPKGKLTYVNPTAADRLGAQPAELAGVDYFDLQWKYYDFEGHELTRDKTPHALVMNSGKPVWGIEMMLEHPDGRTLLISANAAPLRGPDGAIEAVITSLDDITEREMSRRQQQALEAELQHARRIEAIGTLASGVAHDLNNVLSAIYACLEGARANANKPSELKRYLSLIEQAASGAGEINRALLTYARKESPRAIEAINLTRLVEVAMRLLMRLLPPNVRLEQSLCPDELWVMGDAALLQQVLLNLVVNARDAMPDGGTLRVCLRPEPASAEQPPSAVLEVSDTGHGIEPGIREQIFEPFFTTKPRGKGTGLGLAVVQGVVRSMQGTIELESASNRGTSFIVRLPSIAAPAQPIKVLPEPAPTELTLPERSQAVVAEPDPFVRSLMTTALRSLGLTPTEVDTLSQAGDEVRRLLPSVRVAIIDAATREQSPNDPVGVLRAIDPHVGVILLVGEQSAAGAEAGGAGVRVLRRPFRMQALRQAIEELDSWFAKGP